MPKPAFVGTRMVTQLLTDRSCGGIIFFFAGYIIEQQQISPRRNIVQIVLVRFVSSDLSIITYKEVHAFLNIAEILAIAGSFPNLFNSAKHEPLVVGP